MVLVVDDWFGRFVALEFDLLLGIVCDLCLFVLGWFGRCTYVKWSVVMVARLRFDCLC